MATKLQKIAPACIKKPGKDRANPIPPRLFGHSDNSEFSENSEISDSFSGEFRVIVFGPTQKTITRKFCDTRNHAWK